MKNNIVIDNSTGDVLVNNGFTENQDHLSFKDISIKMDKHIKISRECFSQTPLFYSVIDNHLYASTSWKDLVLLIREYDLSINLNYVYDYLQFQCPMTFETLCDKIFYLRGSETLTIDEKGNMSRYFTLPSPGPAVPFKETLEKILTGLDIRHSVFHISSGLDTSILVLLASQIHARPVEAVTCKTRGKGASDEIGDVQQLTRDLNSHLTIYDFTAIDIFKKGASFIEAPGYPVAHPCHLVEFLLDEKCKDKKNIITGRGPDETLAGYEWHTPPFSSPDKHFNRVCVTKPGILNELMDGFSPPPDKYLFWKKQSFLTLRDRLLYDLRSISEAWDIIHAGIGRYFNINIKSPFMDKQLQRTLFFLDDDLKTRNGIPKWYLRETFKDLYPGYILNAPKRGFRLDLQPYFADYSFSELFDILYTSSEFSQRYLNKEVLKTMLNETLHAHKNWGWQIWSIYLCSLSYSNILYKRIE